MDAIIEPIIDFEEDGTDEDDNFFGGWFLLSFREAIILNMKEGKINQYIINNFTDNEEMLGKFHTRIKLWKKQFNNFLESFWNHGSILNLIHTRSPLQTTVDGEGDGFGYIIKIMTDNVIEKIFHGVSEIKNVTIVSHLNNNQYTEDIFLFEYKGFIK